MQTSVGVLLEVRSETQREGEGMARVSVSSCHRGRNNGQTQLTEGSVDLGSPLKLP